MQENKTLQSIHEEMFLKFLEETHDLSKAMDLMSEWVNENYPDMGYICTNNEQEALLEQAWIEDRMKVYGMTQKTEEAK